MEGAQGPSSDSSDGKGGAIMDDASVCFLRVLGLGRVLIIQFILELFMTGFKEVIKGRVAVEFCNSKNTKSMQKHRQKSCIGTVNDNYFVIEFNSFCPISLIHYSSYLSPSSKVTAFTNHLLKILKHFEFCDSTSYRRLYY